MTAAGPAPARAHERERAATNSEQAQVRRALETASRNLLRAENGEQYQAVAAGFEGLKKRKQQLEVELAMSRAASASGTNIDAEVNAALGFAMRLGELVDQRQAVREVPARPGKGTGLEQDRRRRRDFGAAPPPFIPYEGTTSRTKVKLSDRGGRRCGQGTQGAAFAHRIGT